MEIENEEGEFFPFDKLPKDLKEMIWDNFDDQEFWKMRGVSKKWKNDIEVTITSKLNKITNNKLISFNFRTANL